MLAQRTYVNERQTQREQRQYVVRKKETRNDTLTYESKKIMVTTVVFVGLFVLSIIGMSAFASSLAYQNNIMKEDNKILKNDLQVLSVAVQENGSRSKIEKEAESLGMSHPTQEQFVEMKTEELPDNFKDTLKEQAFK